MTNFVPENLAKAFWDILNILFMLKKFLVENSIFLGFYYIFL